MLICDPVTIWTINLNHWPLLCYTCKKQDTNAKSLNYCPLPHHANVTEFFFITFVRFSFARECVWNNSVLDACTQTRSEVIHSGWNNDVGIFDTTPNTDDGGPNCTIVR